MKPDHVGAQHVIKGQHSRANPRGLLRAANQRTLSRSHPSGCTPYPEELDQYLVSRKKNCQVGKILIQMKNWWLKDFTIVKKELKYSREILYTLICYNRKCFNQFQVKKPHGVYGKQAKKKTHICNLRQYCLIF